MNCKQSMQLILKMYNFHKPLGMHVTETCVSLTSPILGPFSVVFNVALKVSCPAYVGSSTSNGMGISLVASPELKTTLKVPPDIEKMYTAWTSCTSG